MNSSHPQVPAPALSLPVSSRDFVRGAAHASVTLVEYGDYECPACQDVEGILRHLLSRFHGQLRIIFRNFPLRQIHPGAQFAAEGAESAGQQGAQCFWAMHDLLMANSEPLTRNLMMEFGLKIGLDLQQFEASLESRKYVQKISEDLRSGMRSQIEGTPTFFLDGFRYEGALDFESMAHQIQLQLAKLSRLRQG